MHRRRLLQTAAATSLLAAPGIARAQGAEVTLGRSAGLGGLSVTLRWP